MDVREPGWFADPTDPRRWRWWDGQAWTDRVGENGLERSVPLDAGESSTRVRRRRRMPVWAWVVLALLAVPLLLLAWPLVALAALVVLITGIVGLSTRRRTWMRFGSRRVTVGVTAAAAAIVLVTGGVTAALPRTAGVPVAQGGPPAIQPAAATPSSQTSAARTPPPVPAPTPSTVITEVSVVTVMPFAKTSVEDGGIPRGESRVTTPGVDGESVAVFRVTTSDGVEVGRVLLRESVTREPVTEVTSVGTYVAPPPPPPAAEPAAPDGCDPNYADACVPIDSDVDCAGGSGNGPSYFDGVARVVGSDIYRLDGDHDGYACNGAG